MPGLDPESQRWVAQLRRDHPRYADTVAKLRRILARVARRELARRRAALGGEITGAEFDAVVAQAAGDALTNLLTKLDEFTGASRFTTWACKFAIFAVSGTSPAGEATLDAYVDLELAGQDPAPVYPGTALHLRSCPGCQANHDGLLEAARLEATSGL